MKRLMVGLIATAALIFMVSTGSADTITWYYTNIFSGSVQPTSTISATLTDVVGGVELTMAISGTSSTNFVGGGGFYFNYDPYADLAASDPSFQSGQVASAVLISSNTYSADGYTKYLFDMNITFANDSDGRLTFGEHSTYLFDGLTVAGFNALSEDAIQGGGFPLLSAVHVQGIGEDSTWLSPNGNGTTPVPEPGTMMLLGSGLVGLAGWGRKKFRK